jgi:hypothetical protein
VCVRALQTGAGSSLQTTLSALTDLGSGGGTASHVCIIHPYSVVGACADHGIGGLESVAYLETWKGGGGEKM